jgi:sugar lactone lactonase YvrE
MKKIVFAVIFYLLTLNTFAQPKLVKLWETEAVLKVPESVFLDSKNKLLYVSNIDGKSNWDKDGVGSISKLNLDGKPIKLDWVTGLDSPKGMGVRKNNLYVADVDKVVVIDIKKGVVSKTIPITGSERLNDIVVSKKGVVYVSDIRGRAVYRIEKDKVTKLLNSDSLRLPNGLQIHNDKLYVLDDGGLYRLETEGKLTKIADGMEGVTDGLEQVKGDDFIVSCWAGTIWYVNADGTKTKLLDTQAEKKNTADIAFDKKNRILYVPTFGGNTVMAFELK